jgi:hypothetical protein
LDEFKVGTGQDKVLPLGELIFGNGIILLTGRQQGDGAKQNKASLFHDR